MWKKTWYLPVTEEAVVTPTMTLSENSGRNQRETTGY
jgi:hypothetical protein